MKLSVLVFQENKTHFNNNVSVNVCKSYTFSL